MSAPVPTTASPSTEDLDELLLSCRYGDLEDIKSFVSKFGVEYLSSAKDERENTCLHYASANGHEDVVEYLLQHLPPSSLSLPNNSSSTPLHWAALNGQLPILRLLCPRLTQEELNLKNSRGRTAMGEAAGRAESAVAQEAQSGEDEEMSEERKKWEEIVGYILGFLKLDKDGEGEKDNKNGEELSENMENLTFTANADNKGGSVLSEKKE
ncbi:ankyrin [Atractiella rhizophila]|nr:ankyrin [Atractiella rhizophila]